MSRLMIPDARRKPRKARPKSQAAILGIGTATAPAATQAQSLAVALDLGCRNAQERAWIERVYTRSGIESRGTVLGDSLKNFYPPATSPNDRGPTTAARMEMYALHAPPLAERAARAALADAEIAANKITHLITASCTGFFAPGLDSELIQRLDLSPSVRRLHIGFMGCHAAFNALAAARDAVLADPRAKVLVTCVELCSLHLAYGSDPGKLVANALFADGSAAAVVGNAPNHSSNNNSTVAPPGKSFKWDLLSTSSSLLPNSEDAMTWHIGDHGFEMTLSPGIPSIVREHLGNWCRTWLAKHNLRPEEISTWAIHPGGPKILDAVADALNLDSHDLIFSKQILTHHGNMSSATILFILNQISRDIEGPCVAIGLGPGLMAEGMLLKH